MKNYIQPGKTVTLTAPSGGVVAGNPYKIGQLFGVAQNTAAQGEDFEMDLEGVFEIVKKTADTPGQGALLYWDPSPGELTTSTTTGNMLVGSAVVAAGNTATTVICRLNGIASADL